MDAERIKVTLQFAAALIGLIAAIITCVNGMLQRAKTQKARRRTIEVIQVLSKVVLWVAGIAFIVLDSYQIASSIFLAAMVWEFFDFLRSKEPLKRYEVAALIFFALIPFTTAILAILGKIIAILDRMASR